MKHQKSSLGGINHPGVGHGAFLPKLTDLNQQSESLLPQLHINPKRMNSPRLLPKLTTIQTRINHSLRPPNNIAEIEGATDEGTFEERECLSAAINDQAHLLTKSRDSSHSRTMKNTKSKGKGLPLTLSPVNVGEGKDRSSVPLFDS